MCEIHTKALNHCQAYLMMKTWEKQNCAIQYAIKAGLGGKIQSRLKGYLLLVGLSEEMGNLFEKSKVFWFSISFFKC